MEPEPELLAGAETNSSGSATLHLGSPGPEQFWNTMNMKQTTKKIY
jgi:hypothetical protein